MSGTHRPAYTLLEVLLAAAIGVLLLAALYVALDIQLRSAQAGRDVVERTTLARSLLARMAADISPSLGNIEPNRYRSKNKSASSPATSATPTSSSNSSSTGNTGSSSSTSNLQTPDLTGAVQFNLYVQGDENSLTIYVSRLPRELYTARPGGANPDGPGVVVSDLRRISYWLAGSTDGPLGLARQEVKVATSDDATGSRPPDVGDEASFVIAEEVRELRFSYFDGSTWQNSWDGTVLGSDGVTPIGPPRAIAIELTVAAGAMNAGADAKPALQRYRHVVAVPVADGPAQTQQSSP